MIYWVDVSNGFHGIMIATHGLPEYKLEPDGTLYLTLLRSVGAVFESDLPTRPGLTNLKIPTPEAQSIGFFNFQYSIIPHKGDWSENAVYKEALSFAIPPLAIYTDKHGGKLTATSGLISLEPNSILVTAVKKAEKDDTLIIRFYNASEERVDAMLKLDTLKDFVGEVWQAKLSEESIERMKFGANIEIEVDPWKIVTLKFKHCPRTNNPRWR